MYSANVNASLVQFERKFFLKNFKEYIFVFIVCFLRTTNMLAQALMKTDGLIC